MFDIYTFIDLSIPVAVYNMKTEISLSLSARRLTMCSTLFELSASRLEYKL